MTAQDIINHLVVRYAKDWVCVSQCKTGSTYLGNFSQIDLWAMRKSWTAEKGVVRAFEIKVARADYWRDEKWRDYLPYCNEFYFVCPSRLIKAEEVPGDVGLIWVADDGRPTTKKKAKYELKTVSDKVYRYILMHRATIDAPAQPVDNAAYWRAWLADKRENKSLGHAVGRALQAEVAERVDRVELECDRLRAENERLAIVRAWLEKNGVTLNNYDSQAGVERKITNVLGGDIIGLSALLAELKTRIEQVEHLIKNSLMPGV